jgi:hypothetical protein
MDVEVVRRLPVVMKEAAIAMPLVAAINCEEDCVVAMMACMYGCILEDTQETIACRLDVSMKTGASTLVTRT